MPPGNRLLAALPEGELARLRPPLREVTLQRDQVLYEPEAAVTQSWFPITCALSMEEVLADGMAVQAAVVGREGLAGVGAIDTDEVSAVRCIVDLPGRAAVLPAAEMLHALAECPALARLVQGAARAFVAQAMRSTACSSRHGAEPRLARWLLTMLDRGSPGPDRVVAVTHEQLARALGVNRPTVTLAARALRERGAVRLARGRVEVPDRAALERAACECYGAIRAAYERLLPRTYR